MQKSFFVLMIFCLVLSGFVISEEAVKETYEGDNTLFIKNLTEGGNSSYEKDSAVPLANQEEPSKLLMFLTVTVFFISLIIGISGEKRKKKVKKT